MRRVLVRGRRVRSLRASRWSIALTVWALSHSVEDVAFVRRAYSVDVVAFTAMSRSSVTFVVCVALRSCARFVAFVRCMRHVIFGRVRKTTPTGR